MRHGFSWKFHVISHRHKSKVVCHQNWHKIQWLFHVIYPGFTCSPCWNMTWILDKAKSWNFHGISSGFGLIFLANQTAVNVKKTWENPCHIFCRGNNMISGTCDTFDLIPQILHGGSFCPLQCKIWQFHGGHGETGRVGRLCRLFPGISFTYN